MKISTDLKRPGARYLISAALVLLLAACAGESTHHGVRVDLTGEQEVPPVSTSATGSGQITVMPDHSVSGSIATSGVAATAAHIHEAGPGKNGPVIIPLTKASDNSFEVPSGAKLTDSQYTSYQAGNLYVNAHSAAHPGGEIRGQIAPSGHAMPMMRSGY
jgi:CHRD domain